VNGDRLLVVVRHAKAEAFASSDVERVLTDRGRADAKALGAWLGDEGIVADAAYVSDAARTRETWQIVSESAGWQTEPVFSGVLYGTDEQGLMELLREADDSARTVVVIGHNPAVSMLVQLLDNGEGEEGDLSGMPTCAAAVFELGCSWSEVGPMCARLRAFHVGRAD